ncbi:MAG TPA: dimethylsulfonioproprionate lyase family protein [Candidatus Deferrimicrobium sp.]|nr:dimethylsulfonioproprionate lyase family protein [Candidatus Deferrimicrobium sp.]
MKKISEKDMEYRDGDSGVKYMIRGPHIDWGLMLLKPNSKMGAHYHKEVEETFYFMEGSGIMIINDQKLQAAEGDAFLVEPTEKHDVENLSNKPLKVLFIKTPYLPKDKVDA